MSNTLRPHFVSILLSCLGALGAQGLVAAEPIPFPPILNDSSSVESTTDAEGSEPPVAGIRYPAHLPHYHLNVHLDPTAQRLNASQMVIWTNPANVATDVMVFHVYPRHRPNAKQLEMYTRTTESLRIDPSTAIDEQGRRLSVLSVRSGAAALPFHFSSDPDTHLIVQLPYSVEPGESIEISLEFCLQLPPLQGRVGHFQGVTNLLNWYPTIAYFGESGWEAPPYIGWHQPWLNEAGHYHVRLKLPADHQVASGGQVVERSVDDQGWQELAIEGRGLRDFAIVASPKFEVCESMVDGIRVRVLAFPEHQSQARLAMQTATECLRLYAQWFGPYPHAEFEIVESYFGWNGNESSGLVMIDERIFDGPRYASFYIDHLVSHEICHQWWFSTVGTDGYREPWMDEGLVSHLTWWRMVNKYGHDAKVLSLPKLMCQFPNIQYRTLMHNGYYLYRSRGGRGQTLAALDDIGHLQNLFFLVYDRGNKVMGMIHHRLGTEQFFAFLRLVYAKYEFRVLRVADFQRELEEFTGCSWQQFFDDWLKSAKITDWKVNAVDVDAIDSGYRTTVTITQEAEISEPVEVAWRFTKDGPVAGQVTLNPGCAGGQCPTSRTDGQDVRQTGPSEWTVTFTTPERPRQVEIDPDGWVLDENPRNNRWKFAPAVRLTPFYSPLDELPIVHPVDRASIAAGPGIDAEGRLALRGSLIATPDYRISPFLALKAERNANHLTAGIDTLFNNIPGPWWQLGVRYEHTITSQIDDAPEDQGRIYLRWITMPTSSFIYTNLAYTDFYFRFGDNFFPDVDRKIPQDPDVEDYRNVRALGVTVHLDSRMPYWNPDSGELYEATYEYGFPAFGNGQQFHRAWATASAVRRLPAGHGFLSRTKVAGRVSAGAGSPDNGEHFRFGGAERFRGEHSENIKGSAFWLASADWRFPLLDDVNLKLLDNTAKLRSVYSSVFYDVGESFSRSDSEGVDHAIGAGLYFDMPLLSFAENFTLRMEYGYSLVRDRDVLWFGWYHAF